jgi:hypothetical protein
VSCAQCCTCLWIVHSSLSFRFALKFIYYIQFVLCLLCPRLSVSLDCAFLIALSVFSNVYLLPTVCPVSCVPSVACSSRLSILDCPFGFLRLFTTYSTVCPVSCVPSVACISRLSILDCPFGFVYRLFTTYGVSCVPSVASISRLSILDCPFGFL